MELKQRTCNFSVFRKDIKVKALNVFIVPVCFQQNLFT